MAAKKKTKSIRGTRKTSAKGVSMGEDVTFHGPQLALRPPSKHHYVRVNGPKATKLYVTNLALREISPLLLQDSVTESLLAFKRSASASSKSFSAGRSKKFSVRVNPKSGEVHVQMTKEI